MIGNGQGPHQKKSYKCWSWSNTWPSLLRTQQLPTLKPPCGASSTQTISQTCTPHSLPVTPPRIIPPLLPSEPQKNPSVISSHLPSSSGQQTTHLMPIIPTASHKEQTTTPYAYALTLTTPNTSPPTHTACIGTQRNTSCSTAPAIL